MGLHRLCIRWVKFMEGTLFNGVRVPDFAAPGLKMIEH